MFKTNETSLAHPALKPYTFHLIGNTYCTFYLWFKFWQINDRENYLKLYKENQSVFPDRNCNDAIYW